MLQHLLNAHTVVIVLEGERLSVAGHLLELSADCPLIRPTAIVQRIANCAVGDGSAVVRRQLILPIAVTVSIRNRLNSRAQRTDGIGVAYLVGDVSATIIIVNPRRILMRIVDTNQLSQCIVGVDSSQVATLFGDNVAAGIVGILERNAVLGNLLHERRSAVRAVCAVDILISTGQLARCAAAFCSSGGNSAEIVIGVVHLLRAAIILNARLAIIAVIGIIRGVRFAAYLLRKLFQIAEFIIFQQRSVENFSACGFFQLRLARTIRKVVVRSRNSAEVIPLLVWQA